MIILATFEHPKHKQLELSQARDELINNKMAALKALEAKLAAAAATVTTTCSSATAALASSMMPLLVSRKVALQADLTTLLNEPLPLAATAESEYTAGSPSVNQGGAKAAAASAFPACAFGEAAI